MRKTSENDNEQLVDVLVIGGASAGLSGALTLARARRSVVVIDSGKPRNLPAAASHGFLTRDGVAPTELVRLGAEEVAAYGGTVVTDIVTGVSGHNGDFTVTTEAGRSFHARRLLVTTGLSDELPDVPGLWQRWGRDVFHCPYCHGWEVRDQPIGVLDSGPNGVHQALLLRQWSDSVTLFLHRAADPSDEQFAQLAARGITVVDGEVSGLDIVDDQLAGVRLETGTRLPVRALAVAPTFTARAGFLADLGLTTVEHPSGMGDHLAADANGLTAVAGVWAAGTVTDPMANVAMSVGAGARAAVMLNADLMFADVAEAVADTGLAA
ncbi:NAD(P)/FAD-dependent oxidoreductase [Stackebrandtia nassauensis]|uniref:FAD-dependent pyridine nucleotide-disulfide oxidoreductase n=1 Tax=Stackebrandtia nassauensis (strain DSM 44728 / CIP 108903 / NRRL B-16338 / NBRC 102104 / LLR-40K-21) TaxID=446470 RepID=D3PUQ5_STANL|nr:NAD(P)/FAD-dependent oxidoreductase [Stackebrandtia nassauensis]ADD44929.1 FAD-dependent pyridine nucleotide-disulfide oxidoreductase [Stackebrandtia nassauensis DSM 44728]